MQYFREIPGGKDDALFFVQDDVLAVIVPDQHGFHRAAGSIGGRIHMGDEPDHRAFFAVVGRQGGHHIAVSVQRNVTEAQGLQLVSQMPGQHHLTGGTGRSLGIGFIGLGVESNILFKTMEQFFL